MRSRPWLRRLFGAAGLAAALAVGEARAVEVVTVTVTVESNTWALNGDSVRQPEVPLLQKIDTPVIRLTDTAFVNPSKDAVTQLFIGERFGGTQTVKVSRTVGGGNGTCAGGSRAFQPCFSDDRCPDSTCVVDNRVLLANPTDRLSPFTGMFTIMGFNEGGTATVFGGPNGRKGGEFPLNIFTRVILDEVDAGGPFFVAEIPKEDEPPLQFGLDAQVEFSGLVALLSIPIDGTAFATGWTTGMLTVSRQITTMRRGGDPRGTPTGFMTFTFMSTGTFMENVSTAVTPFVVEAFAGRGDDRVPTPFYGFLRSKIEGLTFVPEPGALFWAAGALVVLGLRRLRSLVP